MTLTPNVQRARSSQPNISDCLETDFFEHLILQSHILNDLKQFLYHNTTRAKAMIRVAKYLWPNFRQMRADNLRSHTAQTMFPTWK